MMRLVMNIPFAAQYQHQIKDRLRGFLHSEKGNLIVTANPEMLVLCQKDKEFDQVLRSAELVVADGTGIVIASALLPGTRIPERITGNDILQFLFEILNEQQGRILFLGAAKGISHKAADTVKERYPNMHVHAIHGGKICKHSDHCWDHEEGLLEQIRAFKPHVIAVAMNFGEQEKFARYLLDQIEGSKIAVGIGGAFDFLSGNIKRAPKFFRVLGLEWLWRLIKQPTRYKRIFRALVVFPLLLITDTLRTFRK